MALNDCIEKALKARRITDNQVQAIKRMVEQEREACLGLPDPLLARCLNLQ